MPDLEFRVIIDPDLDRQIDGVVAFGDFDASDHSSVIYRDDETHLFCRDLILGRHYPMTLVMRSLGSLGSLVSCAIYLHRDLAIHPSVPGLLASVSLVDNYGIVGLAHTDPDLSRFFKLCRVFLSSAPGEHVKQDRLTTAVGWIRDIILDGQYPALPPDPDPPRILDHGSDGFVLASSSHPDLMSGWENLYRRGYLRGLLIYGAQDMWHCLAARKSHFLAFDLAKAAQILNAAEQAMGEDPAWTQDGLWLSSPPSGTLILPSDLLRVFLRV